MRRLFWTVVGIGLGAAVGVAAMRALKRTTQRYSPAGIAGRAGERGRDLMSRLGEAVEEGRRAMAEREAELRAELGLDRA